MSKIKTLLPDTLPEPDPHGMAEQQIEQDQKAAGYQAEPYTATDTDQLPF